MKKISIILLFFIISLHAEKIKDLANVVGVRDNQLIGYGLVVGLNGSGDGTSSEFTLQSISNLLKSVNVRINPDDIKSKNIAAVFVTAQLPPFARQGDKIDAVVSSMGDAQSLEGGTLIMTPLKAVDGSIYALAQGKVDVGKTGGKKSKDDAPTTSGNILNGAIVEKSVAYDIYRQNTATLSLNNSDFNTALAMQNTINEAFENKPAIATDPRSILLSKPTNETMVEFLAKVLDLPIEYQREEKIAIDQKTGTVVAGVNIKVQPVVITHGDITLKVVPFDEDDNTTSNVDAQNGNIDFKEKEVTVANIARALNKLGAKPADIIAILQNIKRAGAVDAKLEIR